MGSTFEALPIDLMPYQGASGNRPAENNRHQRRGCCSL